MAKRKCLYLGDAMGPRDIDIHAHKVRQTGGDLEARARHARHRLDHSLDSSDTVHSNHAHGGWTSAQAVQDCARAWEKHMESLVGEMASIGSKLQAAAQGHQNTDHYVQGLLHGIDDVKGLGGS